MPIYEYRCANCGHTLDALQKLNDRQLRKCPECGKSALERLMSAPSFRLKGGGWYETDFKNDGEKKRNLVETAASEPADSGSGGKSDDAKDGTSKEAKTPEKADGAAADAAKTAAKPKEATPVKARPPKKRASRASRSARR